MRAPMIVIGLGAAAVALSGCASNDLYGYDNRCVRQNQTSEAVGTAAGAGVGALAGSAIAGEGNRTEGAVIGGVAGAIVGNQIARQGRNRCPPGYAYYPY